jgi:hypothetical protein
MNRPFAVTLLAIVAGIAGIVAVMDVLRYLGLLPVAALGELSFYGSNVFGAFMAGIVALIWFSVARQLWNLDPRGWMFVVVIAIFNLILAGVQIISGTPIQAIALSLGLSGLALILALLPGTRAAFGQR